MSRVTLNEKQALKYFGWTTDKLAHRRRRWRRGYHFGSVQGELRYHVSRIEEWIEAEGFGEFDDPPERADRGASGHVLNLE